MPQKPKPKKKPAARPDRTKPLKIAGTFDELIQKSLASKRPQGGWKKP